MTVSSGEWVVEIQGLTKQFGALKALDNVTLQIAAGEIFGILGPNGSGKTTMMRILTGLLDPTAGSAFVAGIDVEKNPEAVKEAIGYVAQRVSLYDDLTIEENIRFYASIYGAYAKTTSIRERVEGTIASFGLGHRRHEMAGHLSGGWRQRVALGCATMHDPRLVFLDEPTAGLDPATRRDFWEIIHTISRRGATIIVNTHYTDEADRCHRIGFLFSGVLLEVGPPKTMSEQLGILVVELEVDDGPKAADILKASPEVFEVSHFGHVLRVATLGADPNALCRALLKDKIEINALLPSRATIEDVFVAKVREREQGPSGGSA
jgi:ABC-2 type transport system ATP-binding protein